MSGNIMPFRGGSGGRGGRGPDDPGLTRRVARLEEGQARIEATLTRLEAKLDAGFDQTRAGQHRLEVEQAELKGRIKGIEDRFASIPTSLHLLGFAVAVFVAAGVFQFFQPRPVIFPSPAITAPR